MYCIHEMLAIDDAMQTRPRVRPDRDQHEDVEHWTAAVDVSIANGVSEKIAIPVSYTSTTKLDE